MRVKVCLCVQQQHFREFLWHGLCRMPGHTQLLVEQTNRWSKPVQDPESNRFQRQSPPYNNDDNNIMEVRKILWFGNVIKDKWSLFFLMITFLPHICIWLKYINKKARPLLLMAHFYPSIVRQNNISSTLYIIILIRQRRYLDRKTSNILSNIQGTKIF